MSVELGSKAFSWYEIIDVNVFPYFLKEKRCIERTKKLGKQLRQVLVWRPPRCYCGGRRIGQQPSPRGFQGFEALGPGPSFVPWQ